jgi:hypothetical protein
MPREFFERRRELGGVREGELMTICTSVPEVRQWLFDSLRHVFRTVPGLAGVFTISASENLTNCASHGRHAGCPRCSTRPYAELIAEVNAAIQQGVRAGNPQARVIVWDWGWHGHGDAADVIARLPDDVWLMSVSEWSLPIERGGVKSTIGEYSLSAVGPGPRALRHWELAKARGLRTVAKVQLNTTWELSPVPYLPVFDLVAEHCARLAAAGVDGMMLSWTVGGFPSPSLEIARRFAPKPTPRKEEVLMALARERYGKGAAKAREAWRQFSRALGEYPFHTSVVYHAPVQTGPANPLYAKKTGYRATMVGIPYDDLTTWRGPYPPETFCRQFEAAAAGWQAGVRRLDEAVGLAPADRLAEARAELRYATAAGLIFESVANQARFILHRDALEESRDQADVHRTALVRIARREIDLARQLYRLTRADSRIGFEAANQYFFLPIDLLEKVVNCDAVIRHFTDPQPPLTFDRD